MSDERMSKLLSIVMSVHNKSHYIDRILRTVRLQEPSAELVLVDDGSTDGTGDILRKYADVFLRTEDVWEVQANNAGLKHCCGEHIAILQDDDLPLNDAWLRTASNVMIQKDVAILGCRGYGGLYFKRPSDEPAMPHWKFLRTSSGFKKVSIVPFAAHGGNQIYRINFNAGRRLFNNTVFSADVTIRSPLVIDRNVIETIGYLDERYTPLGYDDHAYCMAAGTHGFRVGVCRQPVRTRYAGGSAALYNDSEKSAFFRNSFAKNIRLFSEQYIDCFRTELPERLQVF